jgi:hypothetical protein
MIDQKHDDRRAPQHESPAERENKKNPANQQELDKPPAGRDEPPAEPIDQGKRSRNGPWLGGG